MQAAWVQSLVGELRSHVLLYVAKKKKKKKLRKYRKERKLTYDIIIFKKRKKKLFLQMGKL